MTVSNEKMSEVRRSGRAARCSLMPRNCRLFWRRGGKRGKPVEEIGPELRDTCPGIHATFFEKTSQVVFRLPDEDIRRWFKIRAGDRSHFLKRRTKYVFTNNTVRVPNEGPILHSSHISIK